MQTLRDVYSKLSRSQRGWLAGGVVLLAAVLVVVIVVSSGGRPSETTSTSSAPVTTAAPAPTASTSTSIPPSTTTTGPTATGAWPLTGQPGGEEAAEVPVLAVKIDNSSNSRPQEGLEMADLVFDIPVEGGISRLLGLFQSRLPSDVGPVRSVREVDSKLLAPFAAYLAHSGGNEAVVASVREVATDLGYPVLGAAAYRRAPDRPAPYDLMFRVQDGLASIGEGDRSLVPGISFAEAPGGEQARTIEIASSAVHRVRYGFSAADGGYLRFQGTQPHVSVSGDQIVAANVVVLVVDQLETGRTDSSGAPVPDFNVLGTGPAVVFRDGEALVGRWERGRASDFFRFFTDEGIEIGFTPGTTWIHLVPTGRTYEWR